MGLSRPEKRVFANVLRGNTQSKWNSYYSRVRFETTLASSTYTITSGLVSRAFSYAIGSGMTSAGFITNTRNATLSDTNLQVPNQTVAGENVIIKGVGLILLSHGDAALAKEADAYISVAAVINATMLYPLGIPSMLPGPGGLTGVSDANSVYAPQLGVLEKVGGMTNGLPLNTNYFMFPDPLIWRSAGNGDSAFNLTLTATSTITTKANYGATTRAAVAANAGGATTSAGSGAAPYVPPTAANTNLDYMCVLIGRTLNPQSDN